MQIRQKYLNDPLCKSGAFSLKHPETFDILHAFLPLIVTKLSRLINCCRNTHFDEILHKPVSPTSTCQGYRAKINVIFSLVDQRSLRCFCQT